MKRMVLYAALFCACGAAFASGVENKTNLSTGYLRNPSRNVESERPEAAFYNIAGTAFMDDGLYVGGGNQFVFKEYANELKTKVDLGSYGTIEPYYANDETTVWLYPDLNAVYKKNRWAVFGNFGVYAGGGSLSYDEGTSATSLLFANGAKTQKAEATKYGLAANAAESAASSYQTAWNNAVTNTFGGSEEAALSYINSGVSGSATLAEAYANYKSYSALATQYTAISGAYAQAAAASIAMAKSHSLDVTSITYGLQIGASYQVLDWLSLAAAYRYTIGTQEMTLKCNDSTFIGVNGGNKISYDAAGYGQSCVFGIHARPPVLPKLDLALQYQTLSRIDYDVSNVEGNIAQYYDITNSTKFRTDLPAVLNLGAGYRVLEPLYVSLSFNYYFNNFADQNSILSETDYDNSWELALGVDYRLCRYVGLSVGASYGNQGITDDSNSTFNPVLSNVVIGGGIEIYPTDALTVTVCCLYANYFDADYNLESYNTTLSKDVTNAGIGVTYRFPL